MVRSKATAGVEPAPHARRPADPKLESSASSMTRNLGRTAGHSRRACGACCSRRLVAYRFIKRNSHIDCSEVVWSCVPRFMGDDERFACSTHFYSVDENQGRYLHHHSQKFNPRGNRDRLETRCANERVIDYMKRGWMSRQSFFNTTSRGIGIELATFATPATSQFNVAMYRVYYRKLHGSEEEKGCGSIWRTRVFRNEVMFEVWE
jgi:hypothetical protein